MNVLDRSLGAFSAVKLASEGPLRRIPFGPELQRTQKFWDNFEDFAVFYDVFRDVDGRHVYLIGPMAMNLAPTLDAMRVTSLPSGSPVRVKVNHGVQASWARGAVRTSDTHLRIAIGDQAFETPIQPNQSQHLAGHRVIFTMSKDNALEWIADWARFYVHEHGATAAVIYNNNTTAYRIEDIERALDSVAGLKAVLVIDWPNRYGVMDDPFTRHKYRGNWSMYAQPPSFLQFMRKYAMRTRSIVNVDIDELVVSVRRRSIFASVEQSLFGTIRFNRLWVENIRDRSGPPRHADFIVRKKGQKSKDRGKKWALVPSRAWFLTTWRGQPWTHQVRGWLNLAGSSVEFYCFHFRGVSGGWFEDRSKMPTFDPKLHQRDLLLEKVLKDTFGQ